MQSARDTISNRIYVSHYQLIILILHVSSNWHLRSQHFSFFRTSDFADDRQILFHSIGMNSTRTIVTNHYRHCLSHSRIECHTIEISTAAFLLSPARTTDECAMKGFITNDMRSDVDARDQTETRRKRLRFSPFYAIVHLST